MESESCLGEWCWLPRCIFYIEGVGIITVGMIGLAINLMAIRLLLVTKHRHIFHNLLLSLTVYDFLQITLSIACFALPQLSTSYRNTVLIHTIPFLIPLAQITLSGSSFTTVALTVERYVSLCAPYLRYTYHIKPKHFIVPVLIFSTLYNLPRFFEWKTHTDVYKRDCSWMMESDQAQSSTINDQWIDSMINLYGESFLDKIMESETLESLQPPQNFSKPTTITGESAQNCSETVKNVTLVARSLRKNHTYVLVRTVCKISGSSSLDRAAPYSFLHILQ